MSFLEPPLAGRRFLPVAAPLLAVALLVCYANSLSAPFLLDDPLPGTSLDYRSRPLVCLSFALNRQLSGSATWSYHVFNCLVHLGCALLLLAVVRRAAAGVAPELERDTRDGLALSMALLWLCHPLGTAAVTYLSQRAESLAALFTLATLYCFLRFRAEPGKQLWPLLCLASLVLGIASKESVATTPILLGLAELALPDRGVSGSWRHRRGFHGLIALVSLVMFYLLAWTPLTRGRSAGLAMQVDFGPLDYARSQAGVLLHYLRLAVWPHALVFDYDWPIAREPSDYLSQCALILGLLLTAVVLLLRRSWIGFTMACFFVLLAPTSSIVPIKDLAFEHRVYLPLASIVVLAVIGGWWLCTRLLPGVRHLPAALALLAALALGLTTVRRNAEYSSAERLWRTVIERAPHNARAHDSLGCVLFAEQRSDEAIAALETAVRLDPRSFTALTNLGACLQKKGRNDEARKLFEGALRLDPRASKAAQNLGTDCLQRGDFEGAAAYFRQGLATADTLALHYYYGQVLFQQGKLSEAREHLARCVEIEPRDALSHCWLADVLARLQEPREAEQHYREAFRLDPGLQEAHINLAVLLAAQGRPEEALELARRALTIEPNTAEEHFNLGQQCLALARHDEALTAFRTAVALAPNLAEAHAAWAETLLARRASPAELEQALALAEKANALTGGKRATILETLAAVRAARGEFEPASAFLEQALLLPGPAKNAAYAAKLQNLLADYRRRAAEPR